MINPFKVSFHTPNGTLPQIDSGVLRGWDSVTRTVTKTFGTRAEAVAWGEQHSPGCFNVYQYDARFGWYSVPSKIWPASSEG